MPLIKEKQNRWEKTKAWFDCNFECLATMPTLLVVLLVIGIPTLYVIYTSFFDIDVLSQRNEFVAFGNYLGAFEDEDFLRYLGHTVVYVTFAVSLGFILALALALAINTVAKGRNVFMTGFLLPWMVPVVTAAIIWHWMLHDLFGVFNYFLMVLRILDKPFHFFQSPLSAWICLIGVEIWYSTPFSLIILFAGLQRIPEEIYDAARIDGAHGFSLLRTIIIPYIKPEILIVLALRTMFVFRSFDVIYAFTRGGPVDATEVFASYIYMVAMKFLKPGYGAALSVMMLLATATFTLAYFKLIRAKVEV